MGTNNFLPFCPTDTGSNLLTQSDYAVATQRDVGNQPGVASSKLNNKALRQANMITSQLAQYIANARNLNVLDDGVPATLLGQITATFRQHLPVITVYTTGSGTHNLTYKFTIASGNATAGATYTNNGVTFTVVTTVAAGLQVNMTGNGDPAVSGTLTRASGTGDATLIFHAFAKARQLRVRCAGAGGGGSGSATTAANNGGDGTQGGNTTFGTTLIVAGGGFQGIGAGSSGAGGAGGTASLGTGPTGLALGGGSGQGVAGGATSQRVNGGQGGCNAFGGNGGGGASAVAGIAGTANTGGGGGGAGGPISGFNGAGGGAGGYVDASIDSPLSSYAYSVGAPGTAGTAGTSGFAGGAGGRGVIMVEELY